MLNVFGRSSANIRLGVRKILEIHSGVKLRHPFIHIMTQRQACIMKMKLCFWEKQNPCKENL